MGVPTVESAETNHLSAPPDVDLSVVIRTLVVETHKHKEGLTHNISLGTGG